MNAQPIELDGRAVRLLPFSQEFITEDYLSWLSDKEVTRFLYKASARRRDVEKFCCEMMDSEEDFFFAIFHKGDGRHVGNVRLGPIDWTKRQSHFGIMIGDRRYHGQNLGTESVWLITEFALDTLDLEVVHIPVVEENTAAMRIYEKCGYSRDDRYSSEFIKNGQKKPMAQWTMTQPRWKKLQGKAPF